MLVPIAHAWEWKCLPLQVLASTEHVPNRGLSPLLFIPSPHSLWGQWTFCILRRLKSQSFLPTQGKGSANPLSGTVLRSPGEPRNAATSSKAGPVSHSAPQPRRLDNVRFPCSLPLLISSCLHLHYDDYLLKKANQLLVSKHTIRRGECYFYEAITRNINYKHYNNTNTTDTITL